MGSPGVWLTFGVSVAGDTPASAQTDGFARPLQNATAVHYETHALQRCDIREWVAVHGDEIRDHPRRNRATSGKRNR
jgi:hypothetical protein